MKQLILLLVVLLGYKSWAQDFSFLAVGDAGKGNEGQYLVGAAMAKTCQAVNCEFVTLLGDNFYPVGVTSPMDPQFVDKFEKPYADLHVPFYVALGNHDYGQLACDWSRGDQQITYGLINSKWILPSHYYSFEKGDALFVVLDTSRLFHNKDSKSQTEFLKAAIKNNKRKWLIVIAHHPYISNGKHGNAGNYDGVPIPPYSGSVIQELFEKEICPHSDLVLSGHEHSIQVLPGPQRCSKPLFVVSGGGASPSANLKGKNPSYYQKPMLGFTSVKVTAQAMEINQINFAGGTEHSMMIVK